MSEMKNAIKLAGIVFFHLSLGLNSCECLGVSEWSF